MVSSFAQTKIPIFFLAWAFALTTFCLGTVLAYHFFTYVLYPFAVLSVKPSYYLGKGFLTYTIWLVAPIEPVSLLHHRISNF